MSASFCDASVWLALTIEGHVHHPAARSWLDTVNERETILFCRTTQQALLRLLTSAATMTPYRGAPLTNEQAWAVYDALLADDRIVLQVDEPEGLEPYWRQYAMRPLASTKLWMDAYLAAFARAGGYRVVTADRGFQQFEGVDVVLIGEGVGS